MRPQFRNLFVTCVRVGLVFLCSIVAVLCTTSLVAGQSGLGTGRVEGTVLDRSGAAVADASVTALNQTWARELRNQVLDAYRVSPAPANALFLAKALGNFIFVSVLEALMTPLFVIFYNLRVVGPAWQLIPIAALGTWALVVNGTFFAAMSLRTRSREIMLPLLLFPISIPAVLGMVAGTTSILTGENSVHFYIVLLLTYDVVFTTACLALFGMVLHAE